MPNQTELTISSTTWARLVRANQGGLEAGWASFGVFATAVGPDYLPGQGTLYVGKSTGPRTARVGLSADQQVSKRRTTQWMVEENYDSDFWAFADLLVQHRGELAWSNVSKIDAKGKAPTGARWAGIAGPCLDALHEEVQSLQPAKIVLTARNYQRRTIEGFLRERFGFSPVVSHDLPDTNVFVNPDGRLAVLTRHPQGWELGPRDHVARFVQRWPA